MTEKDAIKQMKKIESIIKHVSKNGYDISILESNYIVLTTDRLARERMDRVNSLDFNSKESSLKDDETIYTFQIG